MVLSASPHRPLPTFDFTFVSIPTSCKIEACMSITHHGVTTRAILSRPISSAEHYDPFPCLPLCLSSFLSFPSSVFRFWIVIILRGVSEKGRMLFSRHSRISSEGIFAFGHFTVFAWSLHRFFCFLIKALREAYAIVLVVFLYHLG
jgi:hypothetical protein